MALAAETSSADLLETILGEAKQRMCVAGGENWKKKSNFLEKSCH